MANSTGSSAVDMPSIHEYVANLPRIEPIPGIDVPVLQAALAMGAGITVRVLGTVMSSETNESTIGENVKKFLEFEGFCISQKIPLSKTDVKDILGGFKVTIEIWLNPYQAPFATETILAPFHQDSTDAAVFTALVLALSDKPIGKEQILIQVFDHHRYGIPAILSADAVRLQRPNVHAVQTTHPFDPFAPFARNAVSPFPQRSVAPSPVLFVDALKANLPTPGQSSVRQRVQEEAHYSHDPHASDGSVGSEPDTEGGFTDVKNRRKPVREFVGDAASSPPISAPLGSTYNRRFTGKISPFPAYFERGLGRGLEPAVIFANYVGFVLGNHDKYANANKKSAADPSLYENPQLYLEFRTYMKGQLGKDFPKWEASIPV
jgi:hypothetical protein